jgi:hypothetical protein
MPHMPVPSLDNPYVRSATINNGLIEMTVELGPPDAGSYVEVSGSATQTGGAFANFYGIGEAKVDLASPSGSNPTVKISAHALPPNKFRNHEDVTFVIRVAKVWLTILGPNPLGLNPATKGPAVDGMTWDQIKRVSHLNPDDDRNGADAS